MTVSTLMSSASKTVTAVLVALVAATCLASTGAANTAVGHHRTDVAHATKEWKKPTTTDVTLATKEWKGKTKEW
jgi:hypothetical protein